MTNILYLLDSSKTGGAENLLLSVLRNADKAPFRAHLLVSAKKIRRAALKEIKVEKIFHERKSMIDLPLIKQIRKIINKYSIDVIHANSPVEGIHAYLAGRKKAKIVLSHHGFDTVDLLKDGLIRRYLLPRVGNIFVSKTLYDHYIKKYKKIRNPFLVKNGVDFEYMDKSLLRARQDKMREKYKISKSNINLGMVGNFYTVIRDQLTICRALPQILKKIPNARFYFAGGFSKNDRGQYKSCRDFCRKNKIERKVHFLGLVDDIPNFLKIINVFVYSTNFDTHALALTEAISMGLPAVANDHPVILETTNAGKCVKIFKSGDKTDLAQKIIALLETKTKENLAGSLWVRKAYPIKNHIAKLGEIYSKTALRK